MDKTSDILDSSGSVRPVERVPVEGVARGWQEKYVKLGSIAHGGLGRVVRVVDRAGGGDFALKEPRFDDDESRCID